MNFITSLKYTRVLKKYSNDSVLGFDGTPVQILNLPNKKIINLVVGDQRACVIYENNDVYCWGRGEKKDIIGVNNLPSFIPFDVSSLGASNLEELVTGVHSKQYGDSPEEQELTSKNLIARSVFQFYQFDKLKKKTLSVFPDYKFQMLGLEGGLYFWSVNSNPPKEESIKQVNEINFDKIKGNIIQIDKGDKNYLLNEFGDIFEIVLKNENEYNINKIKFDKFTLSDFKLLCTMT
jgi:hypothetical protein